MVLSRERTLQTLFINSREGFFSSRCDPRSGCCFSRKEIYIVGTYIFMFNLVLNAKCIFIYLNHCNFVCIV